MARRLKPVSHRVLVRTLRRRFGWGPPHSGGRHLHMRKNGRRLTIPNPHGSDIGPELLKQILNEAGITPEEWEDARTGWQKR